MSITPRPAAFGPADVESWLADLGVAALERSEREGVTSWDIVLDGRRRAALRITLILDPSLALICWCHFAPPINDSFRKSYRKLLRWNDELPFAKFSIGEDERPLLVAELPAAGLDRDALGLALARQVAVADRLHPEAIEWLSAGGWRTSPPADPDGPGMRLVARYSAELAELLASPDEPSGDAAATDSSEARARRDASPRR